MSTLSQGCGQRRFSTLLTAQKAIAKGAEGTPVECLGNGAPHWHLAVPAKDTGPDPKTRAAVYARDGSRCAAESLPPYAQSRIREQPNGCWHWTGSIDSRGYGVANLPGGKRDAAHRYVYKFIVGAIPEGKHLDHQCHNHDKNCVGGSTCLHRRCVNPSHVEPATPRENVLRGKTGPARNLAKETCPKGHPYDRADARGWRKCSMCESDAREAARRAAGIPEREIWQSTCARGHEFTPETTRWSRGNRYCKVCDAENSRASLPAKRKPCRGCGKSKGPGKNYSYCAECRAKRNSLPKSRRNTGPSAKTRKMVYERDGYRCVCCGQSIMRRPHSVGHRKRRSQGVDNSLPNLITLLGDGTDPFNPDDHHARIDNHRDPEDVVKGYSLKSWQDPRMVSVMVFASPGGSGGSFYLTDDGHYSTAAPDARGAA